MDLYKQSDLKQAAINLGFIGLFELPINVSYVDFNKMLKGDYVLSELKPRISNVMVDIGEIVEPANTIDGLVEQFRNLLESELNGKTPDEISIEGDTVYLGFYGEKLHPADVVRHEGLKTISNLVTAYADKIIAEYERIRGITIHSNSNSVGKLKS